MKRFRVLSMEVVIGETDLEMRDAGMNVYSGRFVPSSPYEQVRSVFKLYADAMDAEPGAKRGALDKYFSEQRRLQLSLQTRDGRGIDVGWINVIDIEDSMDDLQVEIAADEVISEIDAG